MNHSEILIRPSKTKAYKKVRLKIRSVNKYNNILYFYLNLLVILSLCIERVLCNRPPKFLLEGQSEIVLRLKEGFETPVDALIYKLKGFDPDDDQLTFGIRHSFDSDILRIENIDNNEANIYLNKELDRETKDEYSIVLTLTDNHLGDGNFVTQSLLILVEDINDNEPIFKPYQSALEVPEDSRPGILTTVEATDLDEGAYGQVVYYLQELEGDTDVFAIVTHHGKGTIRLVKNLDYETKNLYQLKVLAVDRANQGPVNTGTAAILVKVTDVEDQPPVFSAINPVTRISEDSVIGTSVLQIKAHDGDRGINNPITYSIISGGDDHFAINDRTGVIYTKTILDREDSQNQENGAYILEILAKEKSKIKKPPSVKTEITIILTDVNDETPTFQDQYYEAELTENAQENTPLTFIGDAKNIAFDYDQGNNGTFELFLEPNNDLFEISPKRAINEASFLIRVKNNNLLDFESLQELNYSLVAREVVKNGKWSMVPIRIYIRDSNDNFPEFSRALYEFTIPENIAINTIVGQVQASDKDSGNYGTVGIRYISLSGSIAHLLHLDKITGQIKIKALGEHEFDREIVSKHYLTVEARDNVGHGNRNTVQVVLNIEDVNDNPPIFLENQYEAKLYENQMNFEQPLIVHAKDADLKGTRNSDVTYEIIEGEYKMNFTINQKTGVITPLYPMDFEALMIQKNNTSNIYPLHLTIVARDMGFPNLASFARIVIYLFDVNDHAPAFKNELYDMSIPENLHGGSVVLKVSAIDRDGSVPNNQIVYRIQKGALDKFVIHSETGVISVAHGASLDIDLTSPKTTKYLLTVIALDGGFGAQQRMASTIVNITILDVNNKNPTFLEPKKITLNENAPVGTYVYKLSATDLDTNAMLRYYLDVNVSEARSEEGILIKSTEYDFVNAFELNSIDGIIKVHKLIDREIVEQIKLGVLVEDVAAVNEKQFASAFVTIVIEDVNDNNPKFRKPFYKKSITENSSNGITILNVAAYDIDKNRSITYSLEGLKNIIDLVQIDSETGEIVVSNKIDHEMYDWLNYTVRATDSGYPPRSSLVDVFIRVIDENDNNPYFVSEMSNLTVYENSPIGSRIAMIQAKDADSGDLGKITFLIDKMSSHGKFMIDADTGVLMVSDYIDREIKSSYMIVIEAWDNYQFGYLSGESRNAFKQFYIQILDENDSSPVLHIPKHFIQISEYHDLEEIVTSIKATDADDAMTPNGQIELNISDGNGKELFTLIQRDSWNGDIYAKRSLKNYYGNYTININAKDMGTPQNSVDAVILITVLDFNDHAPFFVSPFSNVTLRVAENATIGTSIIQARAIDNDVGINAAVLYRIKPDTNNNYRSFSIDQMTGLITLRQPLDRERQKIYEIRIEAYDQGIPPLSTDLDLTIYVKNVNDYEPQFLVDEIFVKFTEQKQPGLEKVKLPDTVDRDEVDDLDDPPSIVCYFIVFGNEKNLFKLEPETHILTTLQELDREWKANYTLIIKATEDCSRQPTNITLPKPADLHKLSYHSALTQKSNQHNKYFDFFNRYKHSRSLRSLGVTKFQDSADADYDSGFEETHFQSLVSGVLSNDGTLVQIIVQIEDINDNAPQFVSTIFTGGVTTAADFGATVMQLKAIDLDDGVNAKINYFHIGDIHKTLPEGLDQLSKPAFLVEKRSGNVLLNFDPQKGMKGYFDFMVLANDTDGLQDVAHVFIYLLREDQRVRFVLRQQANNVRDRLQTFRETLSNVTNAIVNVDDFKVHENRDGSVDKTKTDLYLHLVDRRDNSIFEVMDVLKLIDDNIEKLDDLFKDFNVLEAQPSEALQLSADLVKSNIVLWLVFFNIFISTLLVAILSLCYSQRKTYKRELRAAFVHSYDTSPSDLTTRNTTVRVPNTNKHTMQGSNPIWLKAYANEWYKNNDDLLNSSNNGRHQFPTIDHMDSLDENVFTTTATSVEPKEFNGFTTQNNLSPFNVYQQIDKLTNNAQILSRKLETTEL